MDFQALVAALDGRPFVGDDDCFHIAELTIDQIRARAGTRGTVQWLESVGAGGAGPGHVLLQFRVTEGTAVILGALDPADTTHRLRDCNILLVDDRERAADRRTQPNPRTPPPN